VDNDGDAARDAGAAAGVCLAVGGGCTLRAAIETANHPDTPAGFHLIQFDGVESIVLTTGLPQINVPLEIDGNRALDDPLNPRVTINGNNLAGGLNFSADAAGSEIYNLVIHNISGNAISLNGNGYTVQNCWIGIAPDGETPSGSNSQAGIEVRGVDPIPAVFPDGLPDLPEDLAGIAAFLTALEALFTISPNVIQGNVISGNRIDGIRLLPTSNNPALLNFIRGNIIGLNPAGDTAVANGAVANSAGVRLGPGAYANVIGPFNVISGQTGSGGRGIEVDTAAVRFPNMVLGNLIGPAIGLPDFFEGGGFDFGAFDPLNPGAVIDTDVGNRRFGIRVTTRRETATSPENPTPYSLIIGPANWIALNGEMDTPPGGGDTLAEDDSGIFFNTASEDAYLFGNVIGGLQFDGEPAPLAGGNRGDGVFFGLGNRGHRVGGPSLAERNTFSGNVRHGITVRGGSTTSATLNIHIRGNVIGRDPLNLLDLGNGFDGIHVNLANLVSIGGVNVDDGNVIASNGRNGIKLRNGATNNGWANRMFGNSIFGNGQVLSGVAIDLERVANAKDTANLLNPDFFNNRMNLDQNAAVVCDDQATPAACTGQDGPSFDTGSGLLSVRWFYQGRLDTPYQFEVYASDEPPGGCPAAALTGTATGDGQSLLGRFDITSDAVTGAVFNSVSFAPNDPDVAGRCISVLVTDLREVERPDGSMGPANNTGEFSNGILVQTPGSLQFAPASHDFLGVVLGDLADFDFTLAHDAGDAVSGISLDISGDGFSIIGSDCGAEPFDLGPGESCMVSTRFAPVASGAANGQLDAIATVGSGASAGLSGTGLAPGALAFNPASLDFGDLVVGASDTRMTTLQNTGDVVVDDVEFAVTGDGFSRDGGDCPTSAFSLAAGDDCTVIVRFDPMMTGAASGSLDATGDGASAAATLDGNGLAPAALDFDMAAYDFGSVTVGNFAELTATLTNSGDVAATNVMVGVSGAEFSREGGSCDVAAFSLPANDSCTVLLRFTPSVPGAAGGSVSASHDGGADATANLLGNGIEPGALAFDPASLGFGDIVVGNSDTLTTTLENTGGVPVTDIQLSVTGAGFSRDGGTCDTVMFDLAAGADCTVIVRFEPAAPGMANGNLMASSPDGDTAASLSGNGLAPGALAFDPASLDFGDLVVGASDTLTTTLENTGGVTVTGIQLTVTGAGFSRNGGTCDIGMFDLAAGADCTVVIEFQPAAPGAASGSLDASSLDGGTAAASLSGNGLAPGDLVFSTDAIDFGNVVIGGAGVTQTVMLTNPGDLAVDNVTIMVSGDGFSRDGGSCDIAAFSLAGGADCTVTVRFAPTLAGPASGSLEANGDGASDSVTLTGEGIEPGDLAFDPAALDFGDVEIPGSTTLATTLENTGGDGVSGIELAVMGAGFSRDGGTCPLVSFDLAAGATCTVIVRFEPAAPGPASGSLAATSTDGGANATLAGNGTEPPPPPVDFDPPGGLDFGGVTVGDEATLVLTLTNVSGADLTGLLLSASGDFSIVGEDCTPTLGTGMQCQVQIRFQPTASGVRNGLFSLSADGDLTASVGLTGSGLPAGGVLPEPRPIPATGRLALLLLVLVVVAVGVGSLRHASDRRR
jgi:hypothetical protein